MRYVLVLLAGSIAWTEPAFAESGGNQGLGVSTAQRSAATAPSAAAPPPQSKAGTQAEFEDRERRCLATAIYFEARDEPVRRQIGVFR